MLSAQWHKVLNDLWGNKTRTLLIVLSIAVGLFATGAIVSTQQVLSGQMSQGYAATLPASVLTGASRSRPSAKSLASRMPRAA